VFSYLCSVTLSNLTPQTSYRITVFAENGVSNISAAVSQDYVIATTDVSGQ
jgi:hypothetical protein